MKDTNNAIDALNRLKSEGANTEAVRVLDGFVRSAARGAPLGFGDIRVAFEAVEHSVACGDMSAAQVFTQMRQIAMSALQSQTPPAVPEGWRLRKIEAEETTIDIHRESDGRWCAGGIKGWDGRQGLLFEFFDAMLAAPQPDHSPDGGEAVADIDVDAEYRDFCEWLSGNMAFDVDYRLHTSSGNKPSVGGYIRDENARRMFAAWKEKAKRHTHPAQPRNEVQAEALEMMAMRHESTAKTHANITAKITCQKLAKACRQQAARLRSNGGEGSGDDSEEETHD